MYTQLLSGLDFAFTSDDILLFLSNLLASSFVNSSFSSVYVIYLVFSVIIISIKSFFDIFLLPL